MVEMGENDMSPENEVKNPSRRRFLKTGLASAAAIGAGYFLGNEISRVNPLDTKEKRIDELTHDELFGKLRSKIEDSSGSDDEKKQALEVFADLKKIVDVNDELVHEMNSDIDESSGKPRLITLAEKMYEPFHLEDPSSMLFIVNNDRKSSSLIIEPVVSFLTDKTIPGQEESVKGIHEYLQGVLKKVEDDSGYEGEFEYVRDKHIRLRDYFEVNTKKGGKIEIGAGKEVTSEEGKASLESDITHANEILSNVTIPGDTNIKLWSMDYQNEGQFPYPGTGGKFFEMGDRSEIHIPSSREESVLAHEIGHLINLRENDTQLPDYLSAEAMYRLVVKNYDALVNKEWGINFASVEEIFSRKEKFLPSKDAPAASVNFIGKGDSVEAPKLSDIRNPLDQYPDRLFLTGRFNRQDISQNSFMIRKADEDILASSKELFTNGTSWTLEEFLNKEENKAYFDVIEERSPWQKEVISRLKNLTSVIDGRLGWLNTSVFINGKEEQALSVPNIGSKDSVWFDFYSNLGQRIAVIDMFFKKSEALSMLSGSERDNFEFNIITSYITASNETFANMVGLTLARYNEEFKSESPNPYRDIIKILKDEVLEENKTSLVPNKAFMDSLIKGSKVANV